MPSRLYQRTVFLTLAYTILIIVWGAFVRISGSGDGCGRHWPLCQGVLLPEGDVARQLQTWIEFIHRAKSGLFGILVFALFLFSFRVFKPGHPARKAATLAFVFTVIEALLGAALVLKGYVDTDQSMGRVLTQALHLVNTLFLLGSLSALWVWSRFKDPKFSIPHKNLILVGMAGFLIIAMTGSIASLSNTLFPSASLGEAVRKDFLESSHFLLKFRIFHPLSAVALSSILLYLIVSLRNQLNLRSMLSRLLPWGIIAALIFGAFTLVLLSPLWMRLTHLLIADILWISIVAFVIGAHSTESKS